MNSVVVILTVYSGDKFNNFKDALESLYSQSFKMFDIFVQEDGPIDEKINSYLVTEFKEGRISFHGERKINKGFDFSLNELIIRALNKKYKYIVRMDADDISMEERLEKQFKFMEKNSSVDVLGSAIEEFGDNLEYQKKVQYPLTHKAMLNFFKMRVPLAHVSAFFRATFFHKAGLYEVDGHLNNGDTIMWMKGFTSGCKFANIPDVCVKVRVSREFFYRRTGLQKALSDYKNRILVIRKLDYTYTAYIYALLIFLINLLPPSFKKIAYKNLR